MDSETLERIKRDMEANRFGEAALTVISLSEGLELVAEIKRLREAISLSGVAETMKKYVDEIERLQADSRALAALRPVAQGIIEQVDNGGEQIPDSWGTPIYEVALNLEEVEALRDGLADRRAA